MDRPNSSPYQKHSHYPGSPTSHLDRSDSNPSAIHSPRQQQHQFYRASPPRSHMGPDLGPPRQHPSSKYGVHDFGKYPVYQNPSDSPRSATASSVPDHGEPSDHYEDSLTSPVAIPALGMAAPKRAYRQRRKDPSCDACRERKVKCDATETTSCSECVTRSVKCQFTKETNRRMSSIKQVQDLQTQLNEARQTISKLQNILQSTPNSAIASPSSQPPRLHDVLTSNKTRSVEPLQDFDHVRRSIRTHSRGLFKPPPMFRAFTPTPIMSSHEVTLPTRRVTDTLLSQFHNYYNAHMPFLDWHSFMSNVDKCYHVGTVQGMSQVWVACFFATLACGSLQTVNREESGIAPQKEGIQYIIIATKLLNTWTDNLILDHARTSIMISMFLNEMNLGSAGWIWLGSACRIIQDIGLDLEAGAWSAQEGEVRRMVYWAIFSYDRLLSLDGRPLQVYENDTEVSWPASLNEQWLPPAFPDRKGATPPLTRTMQFVVPVIRIIPQLKRTIKSVTISPRTLETYEEFFASIQHGYPDHLRPNGGDTLEPYLLSAVFPLQSARALLYRHNLGPGLPLGDRLATLDRCLSLAYDSLRYISRTLAWKPVMGSPSVEGNKSAQDSKASIRFHSNNLICLHIWRTTLIFLMARKFSEARTCIELSSIIGDMRQLNVGCGRYISVFVGRIKEMMNGPDAEKVMEGEEMFAWTSGDLQADPDKSWIWNVSEEDMGAEEGRSINSSASQPSQLSAPKTSLLTDSEKNDWGGWDNLDRQVAELEDLNVKLQIGGREHRYSYISSLSPHSPASPTISDSKLGYSRPIHNPLKRILQDTGPNEERPPPAARTAGADRISIANII